MNSKADKNIEKEVEWLLREKYDGQKSDGFEKDVKRLNSGEPLAYIIGNIPFLNCTIDLSSNPLIPRPETEFWVEKAIKDCLEIQSPGSLSSTKMSRSNLDILDVFSGSGCIGVGILKKVPTVYVDFAEVVGSHVEQIKKNIDLNIREEDNPRAQVFQSYIFSEVPKKKYNYIFANPPYISDKKIDTVQESVWDWEPHDALIADKDGLFFIQKLIDEAPEYLKKGGTMFIEFDPWQKNLIESLLEKRPEYSSSFWKDQYDKWRVVVLEKVG